MAMAEPWGFWEGDQLVQLPGQSVSMLQVEAAREKLQDRREQAERERLAGERYDRAYQMAAAQAMAEGRSFNVATGEGLAKTVAQCLAEAEAAAAREDARANAKLAKEQGTEYLPPPGATLATPTPPARSPTVREKIQAFIAKHGGKP